MNTNIDGKTALRWIEIFDKDFNTKGNDLGELDRLAGDGDFGDNIMSALTKANKFIADDSPNTFREAFTSLAKGFLDTGGTSGPLFGMFFRAIAKGPQGTASSAQELADGVAAGLNAIKERGGARVGDNTLIDALEPASVALSANVSAGIVAALESAAIAANEGARSTKGMVAKRGRASYVGELALGVTDPGAIAVAIFFGAGAKALGGKAPEINWFLNS